MDLADIRLVPSGIADTGRTTVRLGTGSGETAFIDLAGPFATGLHQVDNPVFDRDGNLYVTYSGTRGQQVPVSIFRVRPNCTREAFSSGIVNPTSTAIGPDGRLPFPSGWAGRRGGGGVGGVGSPLRRHPACRATPVPVA